MERLRQPYKLELYLLHGLKKELNDFRCLRLNLEALFSHIYFKNSR